MYKKSISYPSKDLKNYFVVKMWVILGVCQTYIRGQLLILLCLSFLGEFFYLLLTFTDQVSANDNLLSVVGV